ncbi:MAG: aspartyl-tRNA(Asn)/glutamyl-tRNA(Gln) amidotransferase subunit [Actinomycetota bacterium]|jgi:aspartyl-tRNA(Asn)/glutamyl-tRNA(Gln) amidotransferase subunit B|nr:aspartyl-tRNA(Asn)/glutamyl-tRNA(Gln) amidotransferase subunit [Actinomycetota bacterium]
MTDAYETTVGLEIHVELATASKMFCGCAVDFAGEPNSRTCPVCLGLPGTLPFPNEKAIEYAMKIGLALSCEIGEHSVFHRKNYFYPDMPKNYQISQYDSPLCERGVVEIEGDFGQTKVGITRVHLEEDTGKSIHIGGSGRIADSDYSLEDFNRAGTPLVEIVSEPDIHSAEEARVFVTELRALLESLNVSDVRMEEGSMRVDANVSVRPVGASEYGAKVEVKNMNSIRSVGRALEYEEKRQREALAKGETLIQETRHFDEKTGTTSSLRTKEFAFDYRYFPEPDLVPIDPPAEWVENIRKTLPEFPAARRARFATQYDLGETDIAVLTSSTKTADWFESAAKAYGGDAKKIVNWIIADLYGLLNEAGIELHDSKIAPEQLAGLVKLVDGGSVSGKQAKVVLQGMFESGDDAEKIAAEKGLEQVSDEGAIESAVDEVIAENAEAADKVRAGNAGTIGFLVGQVMKKTRGQANPGMVNDLLRRKLSS